MEKEYVMQVAQIIKEQLVALTPMTVLMSWSIEEFAATLYRDLPALRIKVNGRLHAGYVIVVLNGSDYYEVYLVKGMDVECVNNEVCFDELGGVIDRAIESGTDKAKYDKFCEQERQNLYCCHCLIPLFGGREPCLVGKRTGYGFSVYNAEKNKNLPFVNDFSRS